MLKLSLVNLPRLMEFIEVLLERPVMKGSKFHDEGEGQIGEGFSLLS